MAWGRVLKISVGPASKEPGDKTGILISGLDVEVKAKRTTGFENGSAEITIYNANEDTRKRLNKKGDAVIIEAGYEDSGTGVIFSGEVISAYSTHAGTEWVTKLKATCGRPVLSRLTDTVITMSYAANARLADVLEELAAGIGVVLHGKENIADIRLLNGLYYAGKIQPFMTKMKTELAARQMVLSIDFNHMVILRRGVPSDYSIVHLDSESGLLSATPVRSSAEYATALNAKKLKVAVLKSDLRPKVAFSCVLQAKVRPNGLVSIDGKAVKGVYLVEAIEYELDNIGKTWKMNCEGTGNAPE